MRIRDILAFGLRGRTPEGGWSNELRPDDCVHTLVAALLHPLALRQAPAHRPIYTRATTVHLPDTFISPA
jgi:hypothetical protein